MRTINIDELQRQKTCCTADEKSDVLIILPRLTEDLLFSSLLTLPLWGNEDVVLMLKWLNNVDIMKCEPYGFFAFYVPPFHVGRADDRVLFSFCRRPSQSCNTKCRPSVAVRFHHLIGSIELHNDTTTAVPFHKRQQAIIGFWNAGSSSALDCGTGKSAHDHPLSGGAFERFVIHRNPNPLERGCEGILLAIFIAC